MNNYKLITLKNGLRLMLVPKKSTEVVTAMIMFRVGSRNESDELAGISHVLEHMHYKGTPKRPTGLKIAEFIESCGGEHNAFTSKEYTGYYAKVASKHLERALDFLSDLISNSLFRAEDLEREKQVISQEIDMYEDHPMEIIGDKFEEAIFGCNALGRDVIGTKKTVNSISVEDIKNYRNGHYLSGNGVLVLAGNFGDLTDQQVEELALKYFSLSDRAIPSASEVNFCKEIKPNLIRKKTEQSHLIVGFKTVPVDHPDHHKLELLSVILGGSMSSRMFEEIREKRGLAYAVRTHTNNYIEAGSLMTQAGVPHEKVMETIEAIVGEYKKVKDEEVSEEELARAKEVLTGHILIKLEDSEDLSHYYATDLLILGKVITPEELIQIYSKITRGDILKVAKKYFTKENFGLAFIGPEIDEKELEEILKI